MNNLLNESRIDPSSPDIQPLLQDLQGNILKKHGRTHECHLFLHFNDVENGQGLATKWVREFSKKVTSASDQAAEEPKVSTTFRALSLSRAGYNYLGHKDVSFRDMMFFYGMKKLSNSPALSSGVDVVSISDPESASWEDPYQEEIHAHVLLANHNQEKLNSAIEEVKSAFSAFSKCHTEMGNRHIENGQDIEPFGFVDGISQPLFFKDDVPQDPKDKNEWDPSAALSLALIKDPSKVSGAYGYGSYLVFRKLEQNVPRFNDYTKNFAKDVFGSSSQEDIDLAGALVVGRFKNGTPVTLSNKPRIDRGKCDLEDNFNYSKDAIGTKCPLQSHIRKSNPRGSGQGDLENERVKRIVRRVVPYKQKKGPGLEGDNVGMLFFCYQASIILQFAFIQQSWCNNQVFPITGAGKDPLIGQPAGVGEPQQWATKWGEAEPVKPFNFADVVSMKGGEYFFTPSISFLRNI